MEQRRHLVELRVLPRPHGRAEADAVGSLHGLDLDHVGAHRREPRGRGRAGPERGEVEHLHAGERALADRARACRSTRRAPATASRPIAPQPARRARGRARRGTGTARAAGSTIRPAAARAPRGRSRGRSAGARRRCPRRGRHPRLDARRDDLVGGVRAGPRAQRVVHFVGAHGTGRSSCRARRRSAMSSRPMTPRERLPLLLGHGRDARRSGRRRSARCRGSSPSGSCRAGRPGSRAMSVGRGHERHLDRFEHRHVDDLRRPRAATRAATRSPRRARRTRPSRTRRAGRRPSAAADRACPWPARLPLRACSTSSVSIEPVVGAAVPDRADRDRTRADRRPGRARGPRSPTITMSARCEPRIRGRRCGAATCGGT